MKSLAILKMEKNFIAVMDKGQPRKPYKNFTLSHLFAKLEGELGELGEALANENITEAKSECADVSNIVDFIFEKLSQEETTSQ